jgi:hypothetical protein
VWSPEPSAASPSSFISEQAPEFSSENTNTDIFLYALIGTKEHHQGKKCRLGQQSPRLGEEAYRRIYIFMMAEVSHISNNGKMARRQRYFQFLNIFKRNWTSKHSMSQEYMAGQGNDTGTGCDFGEEEILTPSKIKVQGKPYDRN